MEVELTPEEKYLYENEAIIYSIIKTLEPLEKAYLNERLSDEEYNKYCKRLIQQYKTISDSLAEDYSGLSAFTTKYNLNNTYKLAIRRLQLGLTAVETTSTEESASATSILNATQSFITASNAIELSMFTVSQLQPLIQEVYISLSKVKLPASYKGTEKMQEWLQVFSSLRAYDDLSEEQAQQLSFDIEQAFRDFKTCIGG
mmetsp:Transcript_9780/g.14587  ORF Transcript_9780/g.14587 Transcript_9780/m.14587 type:complete len:201 (-) Transcript_9780:2603-3205(-)